MKLLLKSFLITYKRSYKDFLSILVFAILAGLALVLLSRAESNIIADINGDSKVDISDLSLMLSSYGINQSTCRTNVTYFCDLSSPHDGKIDISDLSILLSHYGKSDPKPNIGTIVRQDNASDPDATHLWGTVECANSSRHQRLTENGLNFRRLTVQDGDDFFGERCELGRNEHRYGLASNTSNAGTFWIYKEGERTITSFMMRFPTNFPSNTTDWQVVLQMKQAQPYAEIPNNVPVLGMEIRKVDNNCPGVGGRWIVGGSQIDYWHGPCAQLGIWTQVKIEVFHTQDASKGWFQATVGSSTSPVVKLATLRKAAAEGADLRAGDSIPSHLRVGVYHNTILPGTYLDITNVQITKF